MPDGTDGTPEKGAAFLAALTEGLSITAACEAAGIARRTVYNWRDADPDFAAAWDEAIDAGTDRLEDEARRRALEGSDKPVFYKGGEVGAIREYSDTLMIFLLKARRPEKFRERHDVNHTGSIAVEVDDARESVKRKLAGLAAAIGSGSVPDGFDG